MWVKLNVGFLDAEGSKVIRKSLVRRRHITSATFVFDAIACLPLDMLQVATGWEPLLRANKYLRIWSLVKHLSQLMALVESPKASKYLAVARLILIWLVCATRNTQAASFTSRVGYCRCAESSVVCARSRAASAQYILHDAH